jgi:hypothetical protein
MLPNKIYGDLPEYISFIKYLVKAAASKAGLVLYSFHTKSAPTNPCIPWVDTQPYLISLIPIFFTSTWWFISQISVLLCSMQTNLSGQPPVNDEVAELCTSISNYSFITHCQHHQPNHIYVYYILPFSLYCQRLHSHILFRRYTYGTSFLLVTTDHTCVISWAS